MKKILFLIVALVATLNMSANAPAVSVGAAKPVVMVGETAQDWYNKLGSAITTVEVYLKSAISREDPNESWESLNVALNAAKTAYGVFNANKGEEYQNAYESLWGAYQDVLGNWIEGMIDELVTLVGTVESEYTTEVVHTTFQKELLKGDGGINKTKTKIAKFWDGSTYILAGQYESSHITEVQDAITIFNNKVASVKESDRSQAYKELDTSIGNAEKRQGEITAYSTVIAGALDGPIAIAREVLEADPAKTAKQLSDAKSALESAVSEQNDAYTTFLTTKNDLRTAYKAAQSTLLGIDRNHEAIYTTLLGKIEEAKTAYGDKTKSTAELSSAITSINDAKDAAESAETQADAIDVRVRIAQDVVASLEGADKTTVKAAIAAAQEAVKTIATAAELQVALNVFNDAIASYVDAELTAAREALEVEIGKAQGKIDDVLAYQTYKNNLTEAKEEAGLVYDNAGSTIAELKAATTTLSQAIEDIVDDDKDKAASDYDEKYDAAMTKYAEVKEINTPIANVLNQAIEAAEPADQKSRTLKASADALSDATTEANSDLTKFNSAVKNLEGKIGAANDCINGIDKVKFLGIWNALNSKIVDAQKIYRNSKAKTTDNIKSETTKISNATTEAKNAKTNAEKLYALISRAETIAAGIKDPETKETLEGAIEDAKSLFIDETKTSNAYTIAYTTLETAMETSAQDDITAARVNLATEIGKAITAQADAVDPAIKQQISSAIATAESKESSVDVQELIDAKTALSEAVEQYVAADLELAKKVLENSRQSAESALKPYKEIAEKINDAVSMDEYKQNVITPFSTEIQEAVAQEGEMAKEVKAKADALDAAKTQILEANYSTQWTTETQKFNSARILEETRAVTIGKKNNVIVPAHSDAINQANEVLSIVIGPVPPITEFTIDRIINIRVAMQDELDGLNAEYSLWDTTSKSLSKLLKDSTNVLNGLTQVPDDVKNELRAAYKCAYDISKQIKSMRATEIVYEYDKLKDAIEYAKGINNNCNFTDAEPVLKDGVYDEKHVKYTRSGSAIDSGNYGTFCLPMDIVVNCEAEDAQFSAVYVPETFAILSENEEGHHILQLFMGKVAEGDTIKAGHPFFAKLDCKEEINLISSKVLKVADGLPYYPLASTEVDTLINIQPTTIKVYEAVGAVVSSSDLTYTWSGTFNELTGEDTANKVVAQTNGGFINAGTKISPFRAYLEKNGTSNAKSIDAIEFEFGDGSETTGIRSIMMGSADGSQIFSIDGKKMGNDMNSLNKGVYIINGKKVLK